MDGQLDIFGYLGSITNISLGGCGPCICRKCLYYQSDRCIYGFCYDDKRAQENPYDKAHSERPPRTAWSDWNKPGEQAHWCRGGIFYPVFQCDHFVRYAGIKFEPCIRCNVVVYQDGYRYCPLVDNIGCKECYDFLMQKSDEMETDL